MATYTANYGLHQWVPEDNFQRTDFNEDFLTIDTHVGALKRAVVNNAYNAYNYFFHTGVRLVENLNGSLLRNLLDTLYKLLSLHRVFMSDSCEMLGRKGRYTLKSEFFSGNGDCVAY